MDRRYFLCALVALWGCATAPSESLPQTTTETTTSSETPTEEPAAVLYASVIPEDVAGEGPALLRMFNDTPDQILSLTLADGVEYIFYLVDPLTSSDYAITVSDDLLEDAILSIHTKETCVRKPFSEMTGPLSLTPGHAYSMHITVDAGFVAQIEEDPMPEPFFGVRANVQNPKAGGAPAQLILGMSSLSIDDIVFDTIFIEEPEPYVFVPYEKGELSKVRYLAPDGVALETQSPFALEGAFGYTVFVGPEPKDDAIASAVLEAVHE